MSDITFCIECREKVKYKKVKLMKTWIQNGIEYQYEGIDALCPICGTALFVPEIWDAELAKLNELGDGK